MNKVGFVVLHYLTFNMTKCCCDALINGFSNIEIVIVDNASSNGSGRCLKKYYNSNAHVKIIENSENLGFAKGNNIGYAYLKKLGCNYIIVMNNDVIITDKFFIDKLKSIFLAEKPGIIGPNIISLADNSSQSPIRIKALTDYELLAIKRSYKKKKWFAYIYFWCSILGVMKKPSPSDFIDRSIQYKDVVLHGACLAFTPLYINKFDFAFLDKTFLYFEEDILFEFCVNNKINVIYSPLLEVYHLEDISTNQISHSEYKKMKFKHKCEYDSLCVLIDMRKEGKNDWCCNRNL